MIIVLYCGLKFTCMLQACLSDTLPVRYYTYPIVVRYRDIKSGFFKGTQA